MKIQDIFFVILLLFIIFKRNYRISLLLGLLSFIVSIVLFGKWIFFTGEKVTGYAAGFIFLGIIQILWESNKSKGKKYLYFKNIIGYVLKISQKYQKIINIILTLTIIFNLGKVIYQNKDQYFKPDYWQRYPVLKYMYENSQYVSKTPKVGWIADELVFSYSAGQYLKGINPILLDSELPPLGKYFMAISIAVFNNEKTIIILFALLTILFMYLLGYQITGNVTLSLLPPFFLSFEKIFTNQLVYVPLFDIIQIPFLLASFYYFNIAVNSYIKKKYLGFILANISLGIFISVKFFITGFLILISWYFFLILRKKWELIRKETLFLPFSLGVLILSYFRIFILGYSLKQFFGIQKWIFLYHQSKLILPFSIWPLILFNKWYVWYGDKPVISDPQWRITWPIILILSLFTVFLYLLKKIKHNPHIEVIMIWSVIYILFFSIGQISARYLVIYLPVLYILSMFGLASLINIFLKR